MLILSSCSTKSLVISSVGHLVSWLFLLLLSEFVKLLRLLLHSRLILILLWLGWQLLLVLLGHVTTSLAHLLLVDTLLLSSDVVWRIVILSVGKWVRLKRLIECLHKVGLLLLHVFLESVSHELDIFSVLS